LNNKVSTHFIVRTPHNPQDVLETLRLLIRMRSGHSTRAKLLRLGMIAMFVVVALTTTPQRGQTIVELAAHTGRRKPDLRRVLTRLKVAGIVREVAPDVYRLAQDFAAQYERELEESGITYSERRQRRRHEEDRAARDEMARSAHLEGAEPVAGRGTQKATFEKSSRRRFDRGPPPEATPRPSHRFGSRGE
jgi:hypothetical protein